MDYLELPQPLYSAIGSDTRDFTVKSVRQKPLRGSLYNIFFGLAWTAFTCVFFLSFFNPFSATADIPAPDVSEAAGSVDPRTFLMVFFGIFLLIGLSILGSGLIPVIRKGGYFVGTPQRLVHYRNGKTRSIDWEQFTGDIEVRGNDRRGTIRLVMRTGSMVKRGKSGSSYVPDLMYMIGIPDVFEVEKICRKRIKENDPTPAST